MREVKNSFQRLSNNGIEGDWKLSLYSANDTPVASMSNQRTG
jgi:hypothetical protein